MRNVAFKMLFLFILHKLFMYTEARVFCQDSHARPWVPLGFSCPINCAHIIGAVKRLKELDYDNLLIENSYKNNMKGTANRDPVTLSFDNDVEERTTYPYMYRDFEIDSNETDEYRKMITNENGKITEENRIIIDKNRIIANKNKKITDGNQIIAGKNRIIANKNEKITDGNQMIADGNRMITDGNRRLITDKTELKIYKNYYKILRNKNVLMNLKMEFKLANLAIQSCFYEEIKHKKMKFLQFKNIMKLDMKCARRANIEEDFLKRFTAILNKYSDTGYPFTEELTAVILEKILGKNLDLRHGLSDVNKILVFLSAAIKKHEHSAMKSGLVINLKSRHCLTLFIPGCFCKPGFVESGGQCVMPSDCVPGAGNNKYLAKILVQ